ncbi:MAG: hypothetical protein AAB473_01100 [Patescibacteria group bacterium]
MFKPDAAQQSAEDQLIEQLAEALYLIARQPDQNTYENRDRGVSNE